MALAPGEGMGWLRAGIGVAMIAAPRAIIRVSDPERATPTATLLLRTVGIRDVALGVGMAVAARARHEDDLRHWTSMTLLSDSLDVAASLFAKGSIGATDSASAAALAIAAIFGDLCVLRGIRARGRRAAVAPLAV